MAIGMIALFTGRTGEIILIAVMGALTLYVLSSAAVIQLRRREPDLARPYRTPLYPATPIIAFLLSLASLVAMIWIHPTLALIYGGILGVGWLAFVVFVPAERRTRFT
jgi:ethanolamine permease